MFKVVGTEALKISDVTLGEFYEAVKDLVNKHDKELLIDAGNIPTIWLDLTRPETEEETKAREIEMNEQSKSYRRNLYLGLKKEFEND